MCNMAGQLEGNNMVPNQPQAAGSLHLGIESSLSMSTGFNQEKLKPALSHNSMHKSNSDCIKLLFPIS